MTPTAQAQTPVRERGMTLIEACVAVMVISIAIAAALEVFATHRRSSRLAEERRAAFQSAVAKVDQLRVILANGVSLDGVFQLYGPLDYANTGTVIPEIDPTTGDVYSTGASSGNSSGGSAGVPAATGAAYATFAVGEDANNNGALDLGEDLNGNGILDVFLTPLESRPMGTVTFITSEKPNESDYGNLYGQPTSIASFNWYERNPFGADINGNRSMSDAIPAPFPLDLNGDGDTDDTAVTDGFQVLPVVVTIQWEGPYGPERVDHFAVLTKESHE